MPPDLNKFRARKTRYDSPLWGERTYDSRWEASVARLIDQAMARKNVSLSTADWEASFEAVLSYVGFSDPTVAYWVPQPKVRITAGHNVFDHRPDFQVMVGHRGQLDDWPHETFAVIYVEAKGAETPAFGKVRRGWPTSVPFPLVILKEKRPVEVLYPELSTEMELVT